MFSTFPANSESPKRSKARRPRRHRRCTSSANSDAAQLRRRRRRLERSTDWSALAADSGLSASGSLDDLGRRRRWAGLAGFGGQAAVGPLRAPRDFGRRQPPSRAEDDLSQPRIFERAVLIDDGGESTLAIRSTMRDPPWGFVTPADASAREGS